MLRLRHGRGFVGCGDAVREGEEEDEAEDCEEGCRYAHGREVGSDSE